MRWHVTDNRVQKKRLIVAVVVVLIALAFCSVLFDPLRRGDRVRFTGRDALSDCEQSNDGVRCTGNAGSPSADVVSRRNRDAGQTSSRSPKSSTPRASKSSSQPDRPLDLPSETGGRKTPSSIPPTQPLREPAPEVAITVAETINISWLRVVKWGQKWDEGDPLKSPYLLPAERFLAARFPSQSTDDEVGEICRLPRLCTLDLAQTAFGVPAFAGALAPAAAGLARITFPKSAGFDTWLIPLVTKLLQLEAVEFVAGDHLRWPYEMFALVSALPQLREIAVDVDAQVCAPNALLVLGNCPGLRALDISVSDFKIAWLRTVATLTMLECLVIRNYDDFTEIGFIESGRSFDPERCHVLAPLKQLKILKLFTKAAANGSAAGYGLGKLPKFPLLESFEIHAHSSASLEGSPLLCPRLREWRQIGSARCGSYSRFSGGDQTKYPALASLTDVVIISAWFEENEGPFLETLSKATQLRSLEIGGCGVGEACAALSEGFVALENLTISNANSSNATGPFFGQHKYAFRTLPRLSTLTFKDLDFAGDDLTTLQNCGALTSIRFIHCQGYKAADISALRQALPNTTIEVKQ